MKQNYILVDSLNMFMRAKHVGGGKDIDMRIGMAMHIMFNSVKKVWRDFNGSHVVFCLEGRSWRKDFYKPYKANRKVTMDQRSPREQEDDELYFEAYNDMIQYFAKKIIIKTNKKIKFNLLYDKSRSLQKKIKIEQLRKETY